jgi:hypothetical protein
MSEKPLARARMRGCGQVHVTLSRKGQKRLRFRPSRRLNRLIEDGKPFSVTLSFDGEKLTLSEGELLPVQQEPVEKVQESSVLSYRPKEDISDNLL